MNKKTNSLVKHKLGMGKSSSKELSTSNSRKFNGKFYLEVAQIYMFLFIRQYFLTWWIYNSHTSQFKARWPKMKFEIKISINLEELNTAQQDHPQFFFRRRFHGCLFLVWKIQAILSNGSGGEAWKKHVQQAATATFNSRNWQNIAISIKKMLAL